MKTICVLKGGISSEREVSLVSGTAIANELRAMDYDVFELDPADHPRLDELLTAIKTRHADLVFIGLHGGLGENGKLQAALELAGIPHTGSGFEACCVTMDKYLSKLTASAEGIPTPAYILMREDLVNDYNTAEDLQGFLSGTSMPVVVKPNDGGSSVGISLVREIGDLKQAVKLAFREAKHVLVEQFIPGRELTVTVLDGQALPVVEIKPLQGWYDYKNKYTKGNTEYIAPAEIEPATAQLVQLYATRLWHAFGLKGYARVDFRYDGSQAWFLEVNTLPGMTSLSLTPMAAKAAGISFSGLLERIINLS
ncbi:MAG TPA: D-alanine--D-alanine ligase [Candidatus Cloacimonadota bacterium]|nr:D-alanine--D-alanine ligase [Candidatus Cloacimonadota bacterium]